MVSGIAGVGQGILESYRLGLRGVRIAPALVAMAAVPEFAQHCVEITIGMFDSRAAAHALAQSSIRWQFGYLKLTGVALAILFVARLWEKDGSVSRSIRVPPRALVSTLLAAALLVAVALGLDRLGRGAPAPTALMLSLLSAVVQSGLVVWLFALWLEDHRVSLRRALTALLPTALVMTLLFLAAMLPGQAMHALDHRLAMEQPRLVVWLLMGFDSLVVGWMAATAGSALYVGFALGATWRGWASRVEGSTPAGSRTAIA